MRTFHFYTRAIELNPENASEYYLGRADLYCQFRDYENAYNDFRKAEDLGEDLSQNYNYNKCCDFKQSDAKISEYSTKIDKEPENDNYYRKRAYYYQLQKEYAKAFADLSMAIDLKPSQYLYKMRNRLCEEIREYDIEKMIECVDKDEKIKCYLDRLDFYSQKILSSRDAEFWTYKADCDLAKIEELTPDKALAYYQKAVFYEKIENIEKAKDFCKLAIEQAKRTGSDSEIYIYTTKLITYYVNEGKYETAMEISSQNVERPLDKELMEAYLYIKENASININIFKKERVRHLQLERLENN